VKEFKYLGTNLTNQNPFQKEIKSRLNSWVYKFHVICLLTPKVSTFLSCVGEMWVSEDQIILVAFVEAGFMHKM